MLVADIFVRCCYKLIKITDYEFYRLLEKNKDLFGQLGVTEAVAKKIWGDACDALEKKLTEHYIRKL